jgi:pimeloyl-ACP methyl ester carboxylesterase
VAELDVLGGTVPLGDLGLRTRNLVGTAELVDAATGPSLRAAGGTSPELQSALDRAEMETVYVVDLQAAEIDTGQPPTRASGGQAGAIEVDVPQPPPGWEQAVLSVDARGVTTWAFANEAERTPASRGGAGARTFVVKRTSGPAPEPSAGADRSIFGEAGKQLLKVVAFPIGEFLGRTVNSFIEDWETKHQGYGVREFGPGVFRQPPIYFDGDPGRWQALSGDRVLLFIHGTFSRASGAFGALPDDQMARLKARYDDRIIAFDHLSLSQDPTENIEWLVRTIPEGASLDVDVVCHSRGGLVARALAERPDPFPGNRQVRVHSLALVGAVNNGTILADVKHWNDLVDVMSTALNTVGIAVSETVDLILSFVRQIAVAAYPQIRGLSAMVPGGPFLKAFNARPLGAARYLVLASNYEPADRQLTSYFNDFVKDLIFEGNENDAMVRVDSACGSDLAGEFQAVADRLVLQAPAGIEHSRYFGNPEAATRLVDFLEAGLGPP